MKVLFAVNDEKDAESITRMYQKEYKEIISSKTVYYYNAIIKELQKDKTYDRIVISEDLEMFSSDNYQAVDKFIFEKMDIISDEATNADGSDIPIILLCMDRRTKNDPLLVKLFGLGIYNVLIGQDRSVQKVVDLIYKPRSKKEAKAYYKVEAEKINYTSDPSDNGVNESEIQNILNHYKRIGGNTQKCVQSFDSIVSQYSEDQVKLIIQTLPNSVKSILENNSSSYRKIMGITGKRGNSALVSNQKEYVEKEIDLGSKLTQPVIIPTAVAKKKISKSSSELKNKAVMEQKKEQERKAREKAEAEARRKEEERKAKEKAEAEARRKEEERKAKEKAEAEARRKEEERKAKEKAEAEARRKEEERKAKEKAEAEARRKEEERKAKEKAEAEARRKEKERKAKENEEKRKMEKKNEKVENQTEETTVKRGRGRPRKNPIETVILEDVPVKKKRGRPRKNPVVEEEIEKVENIKNNNEDIVVKSKNKNKVEEKIIDDNNDDILIDFDDFDTDSIDNTSKSSDIKENKTSNFDEDVDLLTEFDDIEDEKDYDDDEYDYDYDDIDDEDETLPGFDEYDDEIEEDNSKEIQQNQENDADDDYDFDYDDIEDEDETLPGIDENEYDDEDDYDYDYEDDEEESLPGIDENDEYDDEYDDEYESDYDDEDETLPGVDEYDEETEEDDNQNDLDDDNYDDYDDDYDFEYDDIEDEDETLPGVDNYDDAAEEEKDSDLDENDDDDFEDYYIDDEEDTLPGVDENEEDYDFVDDNEYDVVEDNEENQVEEKQYNGSFKGINNKNYKYDNDLASSIKDLKETEEATSYNIDTDNLITSDQKIISFVGTTKNGTSFIVNNLAELFSNRGIKTAILDLTKNKNSYYIYTNNDDELREKAHNCLEKLKNGTADGVPVNKNLTVYTSLPSEDESLDDVTNIIHTLLENYTIVLLDCDFETDVRYFKTAQEIYLVQSLDVLTIQPLTGFLRDLKVKNILESNKLRIIINKNIRVGSLNERVLIGGMSVYNDPAMTYMTELFNRDTIKYVTIPFEDQVYAKYLEGLVNCKISSKGYSKNFIASLNKLGDMVYPTINGKKVKNSYNNYSNQNTFSKNTSSILDKMKKKY